MRDARELDSALRRSVPFIDPMGLQHVLRVAAAGKNVEWCEERAERRNASGQRIGPYHAFGDDRAALITRAARHLERAWQNFAQSLGEHAETPKPDIRDCSRPHCVEDAHEWINGEQIGLCELESTARGLYTVQTYWDPELNRWEPYLDPSGLEGAPSAVILPTLARLADDFALKVAECDRLNSQTVGATA